MSLAKLIDGYLSWHVECADATAFAKTLPAGCIQTIVTSPPYFGLRDYGVEGQMGLERTPVEFVSSMVKLFAALREALTDDGTLWVNIGDTFNAYNGGAGPSSSEHESRRNGARPALARGYGLQVKTLNPKEIIGIPWRLAFALQDAGWRLRQDLIWSKPNPMPESIKDRFTKSHEYIFMLTKSRRYYFDHTAIQEPATCAGQNRGGSTNRYEQNAAGMDCKQYETRNKRSVWTVQPASYKGAHFATFPPALIEPCILAGSREGDIVYDPFAGSGTTIAVAVEHNRRGLGSELNPDYCNLIKRRMRTVTPAMI